ncbi:phage/plasmid replication domain-containing protein [Pseudoalteromonas sp. T1lg22]|uniref:phage/plasmid replication domain-containing protein n=1 Tax=Pseudoalteromonas sp. T1lg22 TaxID=2077096 RepID=UPI0018F8701C|nr:phage/plasmid replication protein [Pseudoalteromonas sp. T1lg22]
MSDSLNHIFYDWITVHQDFDFVLPIINMDVYQRLNVETGEFGKIIQPKFQHEGSHCSTVSIAISGHRITMSGNPSKFDRLDNLEGIGSLDDCMAVFNRILLSLGLPPFTKCTKVWYGQCPETKKNRKFSDGAIFTRIDVTSNKTTGGYAKDYIKGISTLRYRNSIPNLYTNGCTCDWKSEKGNAPLIYSKVYDKANELDLFTLPKIANKYGRSSEQYQYLLSLRDYCRAQGVARFEQSFKAEVLTRDDCRYWGLFDETKLKTQHQEFRDIDARLQVTAMNLESISQQLLSNNVCGTTKAANTTAMYALEWSHGKIFDFSKSQVKTHRARLRKIGIDIKNIFDASRFSPVVVTRAVEIETGELAYPHWYQRPTSNHLRLVA